MVGMNTIILVDPKIPQNTGTIARLCAATMSRLILVGSLGFSLEDKYLKRAGLDYWNYVDWVHWPGYTEFFSFMEAHQSQAFLLSSKASVPYTDVGYASSSVLVFGSETHGLSDDIKGRFSTQLVTIPMMSPHVRSLNLANSVSIVLYEALRQQMALS